MLKINVLLFWSQIWELRWVSGGNEGFLWSEWYGEYIFVHILFKKIWAFIASMSIEYSEVAASGPSSFVVGFGDVHDDGDSIFIIIFD